MSGTPSKALGLSDRAQAVLVLVAYVLQSVGTIQIASALLNNNPQAVWVGLIIMIAGAVGLGLKEGIGALPKSS